MMQTKNCIEIPKRFYDFNVYPWIWYAVTDE